MATKLTTILNSGTAQNKFDGLKSLIVSAGVFTITTISSTEYHVQFGASRKMRIYLSGTTLINNMYKADGVTLVSAQTTQVNLDNYYPSVELYYDDALAVLNVGSNLSSIYSFLGFCFIKDISGSGEVYTKWSASASPTTPRHASSGSMYHPTLDTIWSESSVIMTYNGITTQGFTVFFPCALVSGTQPYVHTKVIPNLYKYSQMPPTITSWWYVEFTADGVTYLCNPQAWVWKL